MVDLIQQLKEKKEKKNQAYNAHQRRGKDLLNPKKEEKSGIRKALEGIGGFARGTATGAVQGVVDPVISLLNAPGDLYGYLANDESPYHVDHPEIIDKDVESPERAGQYVGQFLGGMLLPGSAGRMAGQAAKARGMGFIRQSLAATAGGAVEGALGNDENRTLGAITGGLAGGIGHGALEALDQHQQYRHFHQRTDPEGQMLESLLQQKRANPQYFDQNYGNILSDKAASSPMSINKTIPSIKNAPSNVKNAITEARSQNFSSRSLKDIQTQANASIHELQHSSGGSIDRTKYNKAVEIKKWVEGHLKSELGHQYPELTRINNEYSASSPIRNQKDLNLYQSGNFGDVDSREAKTELLHRLLQDRQFVDEVAHQFPELRQLITQRNNEGAIRAIFKHHLFKQIIGLTLPSLGSTLIAHYLTSGNSL